MRITIILIAIAFSVASAAEKASTNSTAEVTKTKDSRGKRNLNQFGNNGGASRREDGYNYQQSGYNYEPSNYLGGGSAPSANNYPQHYPEPLEPIIEIIIQDNNETLPAPPIVQGSGKRKKEQVQVFYVKYHKDEKTGLVIHDPIPALSPNLHKQEEDEYEEEPFIVTPSPIPQRSTTLRTIIRPDSQQYESDSGVHVTFGSPHNHNSKSDNQVHDEQKLESAIRPVIHLPQSRSGPISALKEIRSHHSQGRVVNGPPVNFHQSPQSLQQNPPFQRPHAEFNPQNNFVAPPNQHLSHQLSLPSQDPSKPFHPNLPNQPQFNHQPLQLQQLNARPQQPLSIPVHHQQPQNQFAQQNILGHQQFNQPPQRLPQPQAQQQQPILRPPQRAPAAANFNQSQRPFNYHAHPTQPQQPQNVRFPNQPPPNQQQQQQQQHQQQFQGPQQSFPPNFQHSQNLQRPQAQQLLPRPIAPPQNFHSQSQQLPPVNRPASQFNTRPFVNPQQQQFPPSQGPPPNFRPNQELNAQQQPQTQSLHQHNQQTHQQNFEQTNQNVFRGGLTQQVAPDLTNVQHRPHFPPQQQSGPQFPQHQNQQFPQQQSQPSFQSQEDQGFRQEQNNFIHKNFGTDVQVHSSVPKFEHHITETVNGPIFFSPTAVDMDRLQQDKNIGPLNGNIGHLQVGQQQQQQQPQQQQKQQQHHQQQQPHQHQNQPQQQQQQQQPRPSVESQHRFAVNPQNQHSQIGGVSNHFSEVFPLENQQKQLSSPSFLELNGRNNFSPEPRVQQTPRSTTPIPATTTTRRVETTTPRPGPSTTKKPVHFDLPDEVPDDLRQQLLSSGILENAQISVLDYDQVGDTSLQDLPAEHLANFFNAGGGAQIGASNKVISVLKPNGDSVHEKIKTLKNDKEVTKLLEGAKKLPAKKEDVNLKVVRFDAQSQKNLPNQYIQKDSKILPTVNIEQNNYNRYLPLKINGAQFPIPDVEELRGKKISSVVVLAPVNGNDEDARFERDTIETKQIKFIAGDSLKNLLRKPSTDNFRKWLEKEQKTNPDLQSVVLLVTKDSITDEQEIFMYDIITKTVSRLSGELSSKFVDVAEENIFDESVADQIDRIGESVEDDDAEAEPSNIVESVVKLDSSPVASAETENKIVISSGYSVIKNE